MDNMFEFATRNKIRFSSAREELTTEQLWEVPLRSKDEFNLDTLAKTANRTMKLGQESFVDTDRTPVQERAEWTLNIIKHVIDTKLEEEKTARKASDNRIEKEKLLKILAEKQDGKLSDLTERELQRRIKALET